MYSRLAIKDKKGELLKKHHHIWLNHKFIMDCKVWTLFLKHSSDKMICRPFIDFKVTSHEVVEILLYSDAMKNLKLGHSAIFDEN